MSTTSHKQSFVYNFFILFFIIKLIKIMAIIKLTKIIAIHCKLYKYINLDCNNKLNAKPLSYYYSLARDNYFKI